jgi:hypothetical protein
MFDLEEFGFRTTYCGKYHNTTTMKKQLRQISSFKGLTSSRKCLFFWQIFTFFQPQKCDFDTSQDFFGKKTPDLQDFQINIKITRFLQQVAKILIKKKIVFYSHIWSIAKYG